MKRIFCSLIFFLFLVSTVSAYTIVVRPLDSDGNEIPKIVIDYRFEFSNQSDCSTVIFSHDETIETSESGIAVIIIDTSSVSHIPKYICEYKNLVLRTIHNVSDQFFDTIYADTINLTNNITANEGFLKLNWSWLQNVPNFLFVSEIVGLVGNWTLDKINYWTASELLNGTLLNQSDEENLNVNSSDYWDGVDTFNTTQMEDSGGILNILVSWFIDQFNSLFSGKDTDDLTEGSTNKYQNMTLVNETIDMRSLNQTEGDILYLGISDQRYNETDELNSINTTSNIESLGFTQGDHTSLTNVAMVNETNNFTEIQNFSQGLNSQGNIDIWV